MNLIASLLLLQAPALAEPAPADPPVLRLMSFNIRYDNPGDGPNVWPFRRDQVASVLRFHRVDLCGMQEVLGRQMADLETRLPGFAAIATGRDGAAGGERCAIFYRKERLQLEEWATFWLSPTPDRPSRGWDAALRRICTWGRFTDKQSGTTFFVFNTHFDHRGGGARLESAKLLRTKAAEIAGGSPAILMGDLNCNDRSAPYAALTGSEGEATPFADGLLLSQSGHYGPFGSIPGFDGVSRSGARIDYILAKGAVHVEQHGILSDSWDGGRLPSDHRPVVADVRVGMQPRIVRRYIEHGWRFAIDADDTGRRKGWFLPGFDDSQWQSIRAGEPWEFQEVEHDGVGWYRRMVRIPAEWKGKPVKLVSHGIDDGGRIFVNGQSVAEVGQSGDNQSFWDSIVCVELPAAQLEYSALNLLAIRVHDNQLWGGLVGRPLMLTVEDFEITHGQ